MNNRVKNILLRLKKEGLDGLIVSSEHNISYLTGTRSRDAYLIISSKGNIYLTDARYSEELKKKLKGFSLHKIDTPVFKIIAAILEELGLKRVGFEDTHLSFSQHQRLIQSRPAKIKLLPTQGLVEDLRLIKEPQELAKIRRATSIAIQSLRHIQRFIRPGKKEIEIAAELEHFIRYQGGYSSSFEIIVASGPNSSFPHHLTSMRRLRDNEPVLIDMGVDYLGYKSDLTRIFFLGKIKPLVREIYDIVLAAQGRALQKIKPTVIINKIDQAARQYIAQKGYGGFFSHNLGHGIGLEVHENPRISSRQDIRLRPGMVFTIEPAIYLAYKFGIRLEDMVLVTEKGVESLSGALNK